MKTGIDPKVDYAFKHVFGRDQNRPLLIDLLHAILQPPPEQRIITLELLNPFNDKEALDDKLSILDIKARDQSGRQFNVEMQMFAYGAFRQRGLYYWSRLHQGQLLEGMDYHELRPTIAIGFVNTPLFPTVPAYHLKFELREREHGVLFTDQLALHILELAKFNKTPAELVTQLDRWLYFLRHGQDLDIDALPATMNVPEINQAVGDLQKMTQSELERQRYESRLKAQFDAATYLAEVRAAEAAIAAGKAAIAAAAVVRAEGREEGRQEGREEGRQEGREEGRQEGRQEGRVLVIHTLQRLLGRVLTPEEQLRTLPLAELERIANQLEAELAHRDAGAP